MRTCFQSDFRGFEFQVWVLSWEPSEREPWCTCQYSSISVFLPHFRWTGERGASFLPLHHFSVGFLDPGSMSYLGDHPRHAAGAEVQLAGEAAVAVVAGVGEGGAQLIKWLELVNFETTTCLQRSSLMDTVMELYASSQFWIWRQLVLTPI